MSKKDKGCTTCGETKYRICDVCCLVDNKCGDQQLCTYCDDCGAWLCAEDKKRTVRVLLRRAEAMVKNKLRRKPKALNL